MIPSALTGLLQQGAKDFLRASFWSSTPGMESVIDRFLESDGQLFQGPFVSARLPFRRGSGGELVPDVPLGFPAHLHQQRAWQRLGGDSARNTIVATGTGSGKTESFLLPILDYCRRQTGRPGVKAILIYPMNALATDQAGRIAKLVQRSPGLQGIRAGLYIGESPKRKGKRRERHGAMGADHIITDRDRMQRDPPDVLLTNYKMLDMLLVRPTDQELWVPNQDTPLRFLVVDELHTFDGAQGTDLACLVRRLKARLRVGPGELCCVGTSATLGGGESKDLLRRYAEDIFGERFDRESVITEARQSPEEFFPFVERFAQPTDRAALDPTHYDSPAAYVSAQAKLWFGSSYPDFDGSTAWAVQLGKELLKLAQTQNLVRALRGGTRRFDELTAAVGLEVKDPATRAAALASLLALISTARTELPEYDEARAAREAEGKEASTAPFLEVRVQLWLREMARMVSSVGTEPTLRFSDDLTDDQLRKHLPLIHCRDCGAMGWASWVARDRGDVFEVPLQRFYRAFFSSDPQVRFLWPAEAAEGRDWGDGRMRILLDRDLVRVRGDHDEKEVFAVCASPNVRTVKGKKKLHRDCPFCEAKGSLTLLGFRAARLTSVWIDQLFASPYNDDKKLLTFSDSVQDAAHRAGYFGARTWQFNRRVALQKVFPEAEGLPLSKLPEAFAKRWRGERGFDEARYVTTFLAPNMEWLHEYEQVLKAGEVPKGTDLVRLVDRRAAYEIFTEYGLQSRIGRSLPRTGCSSVAVDPARLEQAVERLLPVLQNEVGGLRELDHEHLRAFVLGFLHRVRERGGILHPELPDSFVETAGSDEYSFYRYVHLPSFTRGSRFPVLLTDDPRSARFDNVFSSSWYAYWAERCFRDVTTLLNPQDVWGATLPQLVRGALLKEVQGRRGRVWGIDPEALRMTGNTARLRCPRCKHWMVVAESEQDGMVGSPCLAQPCGGAYEVDEDAGDSFFGRFIESAEVERVFTREHTGLLTRDAREEAENQFKEEEDRKPWYPNLLSCTPTLEMGIDIGALSSAVLCSVPPAQANYLQRIGRAGRRDGNSMLLTIAQARPHDLYFFSEPEEMIAGEVRPPGIFLNASAVLERQLAAHCLDQWNAQPGQKHLAPKLGKVFGHLKDEGTEHFPQSWLAFVRDRQKELLDDFIGLFDPPEIPESERRLDPHTREHLAAFLLGNDQAEGSLSWKVLDALHAEKKTVDGFNRRERRLADRLKEMKATKAQDKDHEEQVAEVEREKEALRRLRRSIEKTGTLEFLTNQGLLPNYAFPESPVRLRSVIWRLKPQPKEGDNKYDTKAFEYARPAMAAISELAPHSEFFAGARRVEIDQVDVSTAEVETWRFCDRCSYAQDLRRVEDEALNCPQCGSEGWGEESQKRSLLRLQQVFARTSDKRSRIRDDRDERQPRFFNRHMLPTFRDSESGGAWRIAEEEVPFAFEYLRKATFREINFGEFSDSGMKFSIAGRSEVRSGFVICKHCGKVQPDDRHGAPGKKTSPEHTFWCPTNNRGAKAKDYEAAIYLYREFSSEAVRLLLPLADLGSARGLHSFVAAFQLGLRDKYGGQVDHLQTLVYSEPEQESLLRKQFLVVYDTVPGGTGYLKEFSHPPADGALHPMLDVLRRARDRIRSCVCFDDDQRDGCYRCLLAYRNSREMADTSATEALSLIGSILERADKLEKVESLSDISVSGLMDSVLEARFIEALSRMTKPECPVRVAKRHVRGKPGYYLTIGLGDREVGWLIEPQLELGPAQGYPVPVSIDFVLHPASVAAGRRPIAIFLDGLAHHQNRIGRDLLQRMALQASGSHDVWSLTWDDIDWAFDRSVGLPPLSLHPSGPELKDYWRKLGHAAHARTIDKTPLELLLSVLEHTEDPVPWGPMGSIALAAQMSHEVDRGAWHTELMSHVPEVVRSALGAPDEGDFLIHRRGEGPGEVSVWGYASRDVIADPSRFDDWRAVVLFDDREEYWEERAFRDGWRGMLHMLLFLRELPGVFFVTKRDVERLDYEALVRVRGALAGDLPGAWASLDLEECDFLGPVLAEAGVPIPEIGVDVPDAKGLSSGVVAELLWEDRRVAVIDDDTDSDLLERAATGWRLLTIESLRADPAPLIAALTETG